MQFGEPFDTLYKQVIQPGVSNLNLKVVRIDELAGPGIVFEDIQRNISEAKIIIAEITAPNQNVFYELGYAHALNKPTILLAQRGRDLPFDIRSYRVIFYDDTIGGKPAVEESLEKHLQAVMQNL
jgi:nucleoside 2-deoxyribosyltransferase